MVMGINAKIKTKVKQGLCALMSVCIPQEKVETQTERERERLIICAPSAKLTESLPETEGRIRRI